MKRIKDFIYNFSDIFITLLIVAIAGGVIFWRVQVIMGYSDYIKPIENGPKIDIDFSDIDLNVDPDPVPGGNTQYTEEGEIIPEGGKKVVIVNENFINPRTIYVTIPAGASYDKAIRLIASSYDELDNEQYANLYKLLWEAGAEYGADTKVQIGTFTIPEGAGLAEMINIICGGQLF